MQLAGSSGSGTGLYQKDIHSIFLEDLAEDSENEAVCCYYHSQQQN